MSSYRIDLCSLYNALEIEYSESSLEISINEQMSGLEDNPYDDWLYLGLYVLERLVSDSPASEVIGFIGSGNGIDVATVLRFIKPEQVFVTDIIEDILPLIRENIEQITPKQLLPNKEITYLAGRDCTPLPDNSCSLIYANLPLIMVEQTELSTALATTTLTDASAYKDLATGNDDSLTQWSLLSQLGLLLSAKTKLSEAGRIVTLIGGRVPDSEIAECFRRAGLNATCLAIGFMRQSDPEYLKQYAEYEKRLSSGAFRFYDYAAAEAILISKGLPCPGITEGYSASELKMLLERAEINAMSAYAQYLEGKNVGHIAYAFLAEPIQN